MTKLKSKKLCIKEGKKFYRIGSKRLKHGFTNENVMMKYTIFDIL